MRFAALALVVLLLAACSGAAPSPSGGDPQGEWVLAEGTVNGQDVPIPDEPPITLTIDGSSIGGTVCNDFGGRVTVTGGRVQIVDLASNAMACADAEVMTAEELVMRALASADSISVEDGELVIRGPGAELRYVDADASAPG